MVKVTATVPRFTIRVRPGQTEGDDAVTSPRRIGAPDAKNRVVLLDAAQQLMIDEGYAAVTSRRVAEQAELKPQLVHYYFRTMDDLFLALFRRLAEEGLAAQARALDAPQPLWTLWRFMTDPSATRLTLEFMGLANHRKALHAEIAHYAQRAREEQTKALAAVLERYGISTADVPAVVWTFFATGASQVLVVERSLGMSLGHTEILAFVEGQIRLLEGDPLPVGSD